MVDQLACDREGYLVCLAGELMLIERGPLWGDQSKKTPVPEETGFSEQPMLKELPR